MDKEIRRMLIENMQSSLDTNMRLSLELSQEMDSRVFTDEDLFNASFIMSTVVSNIACDNCIKKWMTSEQSYMIAEEFWKNMRQSIELATGVDMHKVTK